MPRIRLARLCSATLLVACLGRPTRAGDDVAPAVSTPPSRASAGPAQLPSPTPTPTPAPVAAETSSWSTSGDFRVRFERTTNQQPTSDPLVQNPRNREVVRFRAGVTRRVGRSVRVGARLKTAAAENPNSSDHTLGDFTDGIEVSLDRAYIELRKGGGTLSAGMVENPFSTTELVWDADVNPQGVAASHTWTAGRFRPRLVALYYVVDEQTLDPDSFMVGGQAELDFRPSEAWRISLAGAYYDYSIRSLRNADAGDTRSNRLVPSGARYVSDFDLLDGRLNVEFRHARKLSPIRLVGDYVKNLGAADRDAGFGIDLFAGRLANQGDVRVRYGYSQTETDAVLAAFSHDNTTFATNYKQHTASFDYGIREDLEFTATWYLSRQLNPRPAVPNPWISRLRLNVLVDF